jgi:hypothetical protein
MSGMKIRTREEGALNVLLVPLILAVIFLLGSLGFGLWAYSSQQDYKNNSDEKAAAAVEVAVQRAKTEKDNEFLEREKQPLKDYSSPSQYGSFTVQYPKTWSAYASEQPQQLVLLMQPDVVSSNPSTAYALRAEVVSATYEQTIKQLEGNIRQGKLKAAAYSLPKVPAVVGLRVDGEVSQGKNGAAVYLPLRDKTIKLIAESQEKVPDFNTVILPNFVFSP